VEQDDRHAVGDGPLGLLYVLVVTYLQEKSVDAALVDEPAQEVATGLESFRVADEHLEAGLVGPVVNASQDLGEDGVGDVRHDQGDGLGVREAQGPRRVVGGVGEGESRRPHPFACVLARP
jgi:hypothetical protein